MRDLDHVRDHHGELIQVSVDRDILRVYLARGVVGGARETTCVYYTTTAFLLLPVGTSERKNDVQKKKDRPHEAKLADINQDACYDRGAPLFFLILPLNLGA